MVNEDESVECAAEPEEKIYDWTIMVYMAGDNNLSESMTFSLDEINSFAAKHLTAVMPPQGDGHGSDATNEHSPNISLLAYFDSSSLTAPTCYFDYTVCEPEGRRLKDHPYRYPVTGKDLYYRTRGTRPPQDEIIEQNAASAYSILNFVRWCLITQKRRAKNYALIFSGHGFGFHGNSFMRDESSGSYMTIPSFRWALEQVTKSKLMGQRISILGFDSCMMSMLEVGAELKEFANIMIASEGNLPNGGWSYAALLKGIIPWVHQEVEKEAQSHSERFVRHMSELSAIQLIGRKGLKITIDPGTSFSGTLDLKFIDEVESETKEGDVSADGETPLPQDPIIQRIRDLYSKTPEHARRVAAEFVSALIDTQRHRAVGGLSIDIAAWDLRNVDDLVLAVCALAEKFNYHLNLRNKIEDEKLDDTDIAIFVELKKIILQAHYDAQTYMNEQAVDIADFCKRLILEFKFMEKSPHYAVYEKMINLCKEVLKAVKKLVIASGYSGDEFQYSNGISIYFPWSLLAFELTDSKYRYLRFVKGNQRKYQQDNDGDYIRDTWQRPKLFLDGDGLEWYRFLTNYLSRVTLRLTRKIVEYDKDQVTGRDSFDPQTKKKVGKEYVNRLDAFTEDNEIWEKSLLSSANPFWRSNPTASKSNPTASKSNPTASKSNPTASKSNPTASKSNPTASKSNPTASKGQLGEYNFYFSRVKNYQLQWDTWGVSDEFEFDPDFDAKEKPKG